MFRNRCEQVFRSIFSIKNRKIQHVFFFSQATIDEVPCGTTIRAIVTRDLLTLEQQHEEFVRLTNPLKRHVHFVAEQNDFVVTTTIEDGKVRFDLKLSFEIF